MGLKGKHNMTKQSKGSRDLIPEDKYLTRTFLVTPEIDAELGLRSLRAKQPKRSRSAIVRDALTAYFSKNSK